MKTTQIRNDIPMNRQISPVEASPAQQSPSPGRVIRILRRIRSGRALTLAEYAQAERLLRPSWVQPKDSALQIQMLRMEKFFGQRQKYSATQSVPGCP